MFLVCDPISWGEEHVPFNASLLRIIRYAYPNETIHFFGDKSHVKCIRRQVESELASSINWRRINLPSRHAAFATRLPKDFKTARYLLNDLNGKPGNNVLTITGNPSLLWVLKFYASTFHRDKKIQVIIHGDFSTLPLRQSLRRTIDPFYRIMNLRTALKIPGYRRIQHIVLEDAVRNAVIREIPQLQNSIRVLDHPIPTDEYSGVDTGFSMPIHFGFLGRATEQKGFLKYLSVVADISKLFPGQAEFHVIGRISEQYKCARLPEMASLTDTPGTDRLSRSEYVRLVNKLHFVCLFFDKTYEFTASGVLLDCIAFKKPIIATRMQIFQDLENRFGEIGYLCEMDGFNRTICNILEKVDQDRYIKQVLNMGKARKSRTPETLANKYYKLVDNLQRN